jgi:hypothetical protein
MLKKVAIFGGCERFDKNRRQLIEVCGPSCLLLCVQVGREHLCRQINGRQLPACIAVFDPRDQIFLEPDPHAGR